MIRFPARYLLWMARDLLLAQGVVLLALGIVTWLIMNSLEPRPDPSFGPDMVRSTLQTMALLFVLYCVAAIVSNDRVHGYYRSIFSRPVSPPGYYLTRWLLGGIVFILIGPVLHVSLSLALGGFPFAWSLLVRLALMYLLIGGLVFFFSSTVRGDWLVVILLLMLQGMLQGFKNNGMDLPRMWDFVLAILPPFHLTGVGVPVPSGSALVHVLLYGAGLVLAALAVLRWRPLGVGGRS